MPTHGVWLACLPESANYLSCTGYLRVFSEDPAGLHCCLSLSSSLSRALDPQVLYTLTRGCGYTCIPSCRDDSGWTNVHGAELHAMFAAEIAETYPDKHVTLVQSNKELVPGYSARMSRRILSILKGLKVEVGVVPCCIYLALQASPHCPHPLLPRPSSTPHMPSQRPHAALADTWLGTHSMRLYKQFCSSEIASRHFSVKPVLHVMLQGWKCLQVLLNEKAQEIASRQYKMSSSGRTLSADKVYVCIGGKPNTAFLRPGPSRSILDERGYVKVSSWPLICNTTELQSVAFCHSATLPKGLFMTALVVASSPASHVVCMPHLIR